MQFHEVRISKKKNFEFFYRHIENKSQHLCRVDRLDFKQYMDHIACLLKLMDSLRTRCAHQALRANSVLLKVYPCKSKLTMLSQFRNLLTQFPVI